MACEYCGQNGKHNFRCPNYITTKTYCYCSICGEEILGGEKYVESACGDYAHYNCLTNLGNRKMIEWLDGEIKSMEENESDKTFRAKYLP